MPSNLFWTSLTYLEYLKQRLASGVRTCVTFAVLCRLKCSGGSSDECLLNKVKQMHFKNKSQLIIGIRPQNVTGFVCVVF